MSNKIDKNIHTAEEDNPETKIGRYLTGKDYMENLALRAKLEKNLANPNILPKREKIFRLADHLIDKLNTMESDADKNVNSNAAKSLAQLHAQFSTDNVLDLAMILANMELRKQEKEKFKKIAQENELMSGGSKNVDLTKQMKDNVGNINNNDLFGLIGKTDKEIEDTMANKTAFFKQFAKK